MISQLFPKEQRRMGQTEAVLKAGLLNNGFPEAMIMPLATGALKSRLTLR